MNFTPKRHKNVTDNLPKQSKIPPKNSKYLVYLKKAASYINNTQAA